MDINQQGSVIYSTAFSDGMPANMCELIEAQSKHETGGYTSNAFRKNNNCFGYKWVKGAKFQIGAGITSTESDPYASYATVEDSVHELVAWIGRRQLSGKFPKDLTTITTPDQYATLLKDCGYFGAPLQEYITGLTKFLNNA
jgi:uncharacterized FlgJ-related protein